ncbi:MAG: RNHCP domain-containing protein [Azospirillum sp.]|nr:RNHCP domain-containing protein [Azospirillum sp.]
MSKRFARRVEDFVCVRCGARVAGDGYTNHCPACLWSLHVDVHPGDRAESCGGAMRPVAVEDKGGKRTITHRCEKCGAERRCRTSPGDDDAALYALAREAAQAATGRRRT